MNDLDLSGYATYISSFGSIPNRKVFTGLPPYPLDRKIEGICAVFLFSSRDVKVLLMGGKVTLQG